MNRLMNTRALALAGVSLAALALSAPVAQAACNVSGSTTTCTGDITTNDVSAPAIVSLGDEIIIVSTGNLATSGIFSDGIRAFRNYTFDPNAPSTPGSGNPSYDPTALKVDIVHEGNITTSGAASAGINGGATAGTASVTLRGNIITSGASSAGISLSGRNAAVNTTGNITTTGNALQQFGPGSGAIMVSSRNAASGSDGVKVTSVGNLSTSGQYVNGILAISFNTGGTESGDVDIASTGAITTRGQYAAGIHGAVVSGDGNVFISSRGAIATSGLRSPGLLGGNVGTGSVMVQSVGAITTGGALSHGILAIGDNASIVSTGAVTSTRFNGLVAMRNWDFNLSTDTPVPDTGGASASIVSIGDISAVGVGIWAAARTASVESTGNITMASGPSTFGIVSQGQDSSTLVNRGDIMVNGAGGAGAVGLAAFSTASAVTVTSQGNITVVGSGAVNRPANAIFGFGKTVSITSTGDLAADLAGLSPDSGAVWASASDSVTIEIAGGTVRGGGAAVQIGDLLGADAVISIVNRGVLAGATAYDSAASLIGQQTLTNYGVIEGDVRFNWDRTALATAGGQGVFHNEAGGLFTGAFASAPSIVNAGIFSPAGNAAVGTMSLTGGFTQSADGQYLVNVDFATMTADRIDVTGTAALGGEVVIGPLNFNPQTLQPGSSTMRILNATGGVTNLGLSVADSLLVDYGLNFSANAVDLTADVDFTPEGLNERAGEVTNTLGQLAAAGATTDPFVSQLLGALLTAGSAEEVETIVRQISPDSLEAQSGQAAPGVTLLAGGMFSCGEREGDYRFNAEGQCGWLRIGTRLFNHEGASDTPAFRDRAESIMGGVQNAISENWRVGVSAGIEQSDTTVRGLATSDTTRYQFGAVAKGQYGPISVYGAATAGWADAETHRYLTVVSGVARSEQDITFYGLHGRVSYTYMPGPNWYVRPQARVDAVHVSIDDFTETGVGALGLAVQGRDDWSVSFSPSVEVGGESDEGGNLFRPWIRAGLTVFDDYRSTTVANFIGAPATVPPFAATSANDDLFADFGVGLNILTQDYEFRLSYEGRISDRTDAHDASVKFIRRF